MALTAEAHPAPTVDAAAACLRSAIATGSLRPGERIKEIPVSMSFGLSRGRVREALRLLAEEGLVEITPNVGANVCVVNHRDLMELYAQRLALGALALRSVAGTDDLDGASSALDELTRAVRRRDADAAVEADLVFQDELVRTSSLRRTVRLFERTTIQLRVYAGMLGVDYRPHLPAMRREDAQLLELVRDGDLPRLQELWRTKLEGWLECFVTHVDGPLDQELWRTVYVGQLD